MAIIQGRGGEGMGAEGSRGGGGGGRIVVCPKLVNIRISSTKAMANQSEKVGMIQIQQPPYSSAPWKGRNS